VFPISWIHKSKEILDLSTIDEPRFLIIQIAGIGDLVLSTPVLDGLKEKYPGCKIDVLTSSRAAGLLQGHPAVNRIYPFDIDTFKNPLSLLSFGNSATANNQLSSLRKNRYHALLSLNNVATTRGGFTLGLVLKTLKIPLWVGRNTNGRAPYFDFAVEESTKDPVPEVLTKLKVASLVGVNPAPRSLTLPVSKVEREKAAKLLKGDRKWVAILPGANVPDKIWPLDRFAVIAKWLVEKGYNIVTLGGNGDIEAGAIVSSVAGHDNSFRLEGKLTLRETTAILQQSVLAVTNDTGPMHMAAAVGTPLVALFCSQNAVRYRPWAMQNRFRLLTHEPKDTDPSSNIGMYESITTVTIDEVKKAITEMLEGNDFE
jgi:lipopolysaccharide heptosyltransferase II